jgi:LPS O-antigen subunit length determinant protein (WzzB/FepE family)
MNTNSNQDFPTNPVKAYDEITLIELLKKVWVRKTIILRGVLIGLGIGLFVALASPKEFTSSVTFIPQTASKGGASGLGGLASLAGINLPSGGDTQEIGPELYPKLAADINFKRVLAGTYIHPEGMEDSVRFTTYFDEIHKPAALDYLKKYTLGLPGVLIKAVRGENPTLAVSTGQASSELIFTSQEELDSYKLLDDYLKITSNKKEGYVDIAFTMPEPVLAAQMVLAAQRLLQQEVIAFRIRNAQAQLEFTEKQYEEKQREFDAIHARLASFKDRNRNIASSFAESEEQKLEAEFSLKVAIFTELAKQLEQARLQVKKDTPVFSTIQSATVPLVKSAPNRPIILLACMMIGLVGSLGYIGIIELMKEVKEQWGKN